ncbi:hypothetical protein CIP107532_00660 [Corynebacterium diphtheriae]|nr:hypothetical protein CIP107514_00573 [Corynebacterium diphtheriae]CAB0552179.1 hypothetical protein CIP107532_00660 [Corynebacterium diphtheriae]CAB0590141.1 hypothetical protein CIP107559_00720 [Corynebacterium diphtheriae]CAB0590228.1 hypothetical protein CIP107552_00738 [Corynebacterium diphtheriae]CAB0593504.1 hypothetical protein CIP107557_00724 [Corynebacterium diphtheriae]
MRHPDNACAAGFPFVGGVALLTPRQKSSHRPYFSLIMVNKYFPRTTYALDVDGGYHAAVERRD